jgi:DNA-binding NarL/FixJ family response regulator
MERVAMTEPIKVLVADDHDVVRKGLVSVFKLESDIRVVGQAVDAREAIEKTVELKPDVVVMDIFMPGGGGLEATSALVQRSSESKVLILTVSSSEKDLFDAVRFGARGYLLKSASTEDIVAAIRRVAAGEAILSPFIAGKLLDEFRREQSPGATLSARETEVIKLVGQGLTNREIAEQLTITQGSVKTYLQRILEKLHLKNRNAAMAFALKRGLG